MKILLTPLLALCSLVAVAQNAPLQHSIDSLFSRYDDTTPGCAVLIVKDHKVIFEKGYGMANLEYGMPITPTSVFDIASVSKQFTGYAISTLIQQGKISPDDDIHKYLPDVPQFSKPITIRNLIHHTSGLRDWPGGLTMAGWRWGEQFRWDDILRMVKQQKDLDFDPGSEHQYSNTGYNLLAAIVEKVSGKSFPDYISDNIFKPLGMNNSRVLGDPSEVIKNLATSYYTWGGGPYRKDFDQLTAWGSSSIYTNVEDLAKWVEFFQKGLENKDPVIMRMTETDKLNNGKQIDYAYGLNIVNDNGVRNINHDGGWASYATIISNYPDQKLSIIILSNSSDFDPNGSAEEVARLLLKDKLKPAGKREDLSENPNITVDNTLLEKYVGTYMLGPHWYVTFTLDSGHMFSQATAEQKFPAFMKEKNIMWVPAYRSSVTFLDVKGKVDSIRYHGSVAPRVHMVDLSQMNLNEFCGNYYSPELETTYKIYFDGKSLAVHQMRIGEFGIQPDGVDKDYFSGGVGNFQFTRDNNGKITGFKLSSGRIRNIWFERKE
jgi:CubicO group peptidase (beta-lactamase class C family)